MVELTTIRWKLLAGKVSGLDDGEVERIVELISESLGYEAPDANADDKKQDEEPVSVKPPVSEEDYKEEWFVSPNQGGAISPKFIVLHDSIGSFRGGISWIMQSRSKVSYHYLIDKDGSRAQLVGDSKRAYHAGKSRWKGYNGLNGHSIGISFTDDTHKRDITIEEIDSAAKKCVYLMEKFPAINVDDIITHQMIAPSRKTDTSPKAHAAVVARVKELLGIV